ncbi:Methylglutaconyl-CoA hydratase [Hibiscus syriacus]|uniref:Methylglutaconyl-CoA hydratase n=1 Tax=Hibiscus syriacus TaxID=106335 RepID=A0A6A2X8L9_HIBSY|nr:Methylglutaconyl-CoA hydratase [Hibiscus syriacus]
MAVLTALTRSLGQNCARRSKISIVSQNSPHNSRFQTLRTLILEPSLSPSVKIHRISECDSGIVEVYLDRPEAKNAIGNEMLSGLRHAFEAIGQDLSARVVMISSSVPKVFCTGADLKMLILWFTWTLIGNPNATEKSKHKVPAKGIKGFMEIYLNSTPRRDSLSIVAFHQLMTKKSVVMNTPTLNEHTLAWEDDCRKPLKAILVISSSASSDKVHYSSSSRKFSEPVIFLSAVPIIIEGAALGGGLEMALSCDLRICGENALLCLPETGLTIIPGAGGTQRLPRLVGKSIAKELIFTGRRIGGRDAMSIDLANYCVPAGEAHPKALEIVWEINQKGPIAIRMAKRAINEGIGFRRSVLQTAFRYEGSLGRLSCIC